MQVIHVTGTLGRDAELRQAGSSEVAAFNVAVNQGYGDKKTTNWYRCQVWGKRASSLAPHLSKATKVAISGEFSVSEYQGKTQLEIRVNDVDIMGGGQRQERQQPQRKQEYPDNLDDDFGDSVPF